MEFFHHFKLAPRCFINVLCLKYPKDKELQRFINVFAQWNVLIKYERSFGSVGVTLNDYAIFKQMKTVLRCASL